MSRQKVPVSSSVSGAASKAAVERNRAVTALRKRFTESATKNDREYSDDALMQLIDSVVCFYELCGVGEVGLRIWRITRRLTTDLFLKYFAAIERTQGTRRRPSEARMKEAFRFLISNRALWPDQSWEELRSIADDYRTVHGVTHGSASEALLLLYGALSETKTLAELLEVWTRCISANAAQGADPEESLLAILRLFRKEPIRFGIVYLPPALQHLVVPGLFEYLSNLNDEETPTKCRFIRFMSDYVVCPIAISMRTTQKVICECNTIHP